MMRAIVLAGSASGAGKTVAAMGFILAGRARGLVVRAAKVGPDFIDAAYLEEASAAPCANLDVWMLGQCGVDTLLRRIEEDEPYFLVIEGAMGLFDGGLGSTAALAESLALPIVLIVSAKGVGESIAALARGYLIEKPSLTFAGLLASHVGSPRHAALVDAALSPLAREFGIPYLGSLVRAGAPSLPSRHLGLVSVTESGLNFETLRIWFEEHCDCERILPKPRRKPGSEPQGGAAGRRFFAGRGRSFDITIAIACDEAFSFCYADLPALFAELGCETVFFSPLHDTHIPACQGIVLPGGYPECYASTLSENWAMRASFACARDRDVPIYAECGGMLALFSAYWVNGLRYPMFGLLPGCARLKDSCQALGYREARVLWPQLGDVRVRGHEFHYAVIEQTDDLAISHPLWQLFDREGRDLGPSGIVYRRVAASWLHLPPEGGRAFFSAWTAYLRECARA